MAKIYATLDPGAKGSNLTLSNGDKTVVHSSAASWNHVRATLGKPISEGGIWYFEHTIDVLTVSSNRHLIGYANADADLDNFVGSLNGDSCGIRRSTAGEEFYNNTASAIVFGATPQGSIIGHEIDLDSNTYRQSINGVWQGYVTRGFPATVAGNFSGTPKLIYPAFSFFELQQVTVNFGQDTFNTPPGGGVNAGWFEEVAAAGRRRKTLIGKN